MENQRTLILSGMGLNCEKETKYACLQSGAKHVDIVHTLRFLKGAVDLGQYNFIIFIGGFLDGDYLGSARVGANRFKFSRESEYNLKQELIDFIGKKKLILGICNGFQLLVKLGLLPDETQAFSSQSVSLTKNRNGIFEDRWVHLRVNPENDTVFTKDIELIYLPVRHGEGRIVVSDEETRKKLINENLIAISYADESGRTTDQYPANPNGSWQSIAAISNRQGTILGMMPHPEAYNHFTNHPHWTRIPFETEDGDGLKIFKNAYKYLNS